MGAAWSTEKVTITSSPASLGYPKYWLLDSLAFGTVEVVITSTCPSLWFGLSSFVWGRSPQGQASSLELRKSASSSSDKWQRRMKVHLWSDGTYIGSRMSTGQQSEGIAVEVSRGSPCFEMRSNDGGFLNSLSRNGCSIPLNHAADLNSLANVD